MRGSPAHGKLSRTRVERSQEYPLESRRRDLCPLPLILAACGKPSGLSLPLRHSHPAPMARPEPFWGTRFPAWGVFPPEAGGTREWSPWAEVEAESRQQEVGWQSTNSPSSKWAHHCLHLQRRKTFLCLPASIPALGAGAGRQHRSFLVKPSR